MPKTIPAQKSKKPGPGVWKVPMPSRKDIAQTKIESANQKRPVNWPRRFNILCITPSFLKVEMILQSLNPSVAKKRCRNRARVLKKRCSGTFGSWLHAFPDETRTSPKVKSHGTPNIRRIRNCKVLEVPLPGFGNATSGSICDLRY